MDACFVSFSLMMHDLKMSEQCLRQQKKTDKTSTGGITKTCIFLNYLAGLFKASINEMIKKNSAGGVQTAPRY
jgi:hypothetical protein